MAKPVTMWAALFALLNSITRTYQDNVDGINEAGDVATIMPDFGTVKATIKEAATPVKHAPLPKPISPMAMLLAMVPLSGPYSELCSILAKNMDCLQESIKVLSSKLSQTQHQLQQQTSLATLLINKINLFAGLVGTPNPVQASPTVWHAVLEVQLQNIQLTEQFKQLPTTKLDLDGLMEALEQDLRGSNKQHTLLETKVWETSAASLRKFMNLDQLEGLLPKVIKAKLLPELRKMKPLLLRTQHFLNNILPSLSPNATVKVDTFGPSSESTWADKDNVANLDAMEVDTTISAR